MNNFDFLLHREILDGNQFENLIPASACKKIESGTGNTELSMQWIKEVALEFYPQMQKVAKILQKESLQKTCEKIHWFAYNHFQYMADDDDQMLRSPSCSWKERHTGIDCKSYSIVVSAILLNLELKHYVRKIKQPGYAPEHWTHVYVIVPKDQVTGNLKKGYFTIDGTIPTVAEPAKITDKDLFMNQFKLNGASGLNGTKFSFSDIGSFVNNYKCIGGTSFGEDKMTAQSQKIYTHFEEIVTAINSAVASGNMGELAEEVNYFIGSAHVFVGGYMRKTHATTGWNPCSKKNLEGMIKVSEFYANVVGTALNGWLEKYFNKGASMGNVTYNNTPFNQQYGLWLETFDIVKPKPSYSIKSGVNVPKFEITQYVAEHIGTNGQLNVGTFLQGLSSFISTVTPSNPNTGSFPITDTDGGYYNQPVNSAPSQAGMGTIVGWALVAGGLAYAFTQMKDKPATAKKQTAKK